MRYLGNKESLLPEIYNLLSEKNLLKKELTFFDAFCGAGAVSDFAKQYFGKLIINDNLTWSVLYTNGRVCAEQCKFELLGFNPFEYLNGNREIRKGFFYKNYSHGDSERMYFTEENASRIDYFRSQIENWWKLNLLTKNEYHYLLACLIESVSDVSNTAGVYGAFLKKWDSRALKPIYFDKVDSRPVACDNVILCNDKIENIISDIECDILYLDPPYTQNQYGTQYHLLETLILDDEPQLSKITGSRSTSPMRSDWSKEYKSNILFDKLLANTKAQYVILSYNNTGFMSKNFIEASMKRYGKSETFICKKIPYKKYQNWKSQNEDEYFEYLFFVEMIEKSEVLYESPLNYIGSKSKIVNDIISFLPNEINEFVDAFGGGFNVGINVSANKVIYNDLNYFVKDLVESFRNFDTYKYLMFMKKTINKFKLEKSDSESYQNIRAYYNSFPKEKRDPRLLFIVILYGFQQQIRFNGSHEFNNPVGMRWFNDKVLEKMISFSRIIKEKECIFKSEDCLQRDTKLDGYTFVYLDPPYKLTTSSYNDGKRGFNGWNDALEDELFSFGNDLSKNKIPFMLSYVIEHKGQKNYKLENWVKENNYTVIELGDILGISGSRRKEVLIINYDI